MSFIDFDDFYRICSDRNNECKHEEFIIMRLKNQPSRDQLSGEKSSHLYHYGEIAESDMINENSHKVLS